ncbi:Tat protein [Devosia pacifica]|uniref:Tat protein n=2 Tax=Devosia pacifica TaxID=1335967 RepID=A0A918S963_9HYPH|nr:Tat protein [Devosia pacifica]
MQQAAREGRILQLPSVDLRIDQPIEVPAGLVIQGVAGQTRLIISGETGLNLSGLNAAVLRDLVFSGGRTQISMQAVRSATIANCQFTDALLIAIDAQQSAAVIADCRFERMGDAAIHSMDGLGLTISGCTIDDCGNAGIRIWRSENGRDASIISSNRIQNVDWRGGGNGQNGNAINVFRADEVIIANNHLADCAFTAVRLNGSRDTQVSGNICVGHGEVAIFSEFSFSGSVIANNIVDDAAGGISITNLDVEGRLAVCQGNLVRNIRPRSDVNPDTVPFGIHAEASTAITGNTVTNVPGVGISAGWGPFLDQVLVNGNLVSDTEIGIGVSVVEDSGPVQVSGNLVSNAAVAAVAGLRWDQVAEPDLIANAGNYAHVSVGP